MGRVSRDQLVLPNSPAEWSAVLEEARKLLRWGGAGEQGIADFIADGKVPSPIGPGGGTYGDLGSAMETEHDRQLVAIYFPTDRELESHMRWHTYCRLHGYPAGALIGADKGPDSEYPPHPCSLGKGRWVGLTWGQVRKALRGDLGPEAEPKQMSIFDDATRAKAREIAARW